jgi:hypothetical protein
MEVPEPPEITGGEKLAVANGGNPDTFRVTLPWNPPDAVIVKT